MRRSRTALAFLLCLALAFSLCGCSSGGDPFARWRIDGVGGVDALAGEGEPDSQLGSKGSLYLNMKSNHYYVKGATGWKDRGYLGETGYCAAVFRDITDGSYLVRMVEEGTKLTAPEGIGTGDGYVGWYRERLEKWDFGADTVKKSVTLYTAKVQELPRVTAPLTYYDIVRETIDPEGYTEVLLIFLKYTDGVSPSLEELDKQFNGITDSDHRIESVASYYHYNSQGRKELHFTIVIHETGLTCKQARDMIDAYPKYGSLTENSYQAVLDGWEGDFGALFDRDRNGYADAVLFLSGENPDLFNDNGERWRVMSGGSAVWSSWPGTPEKPALGRYARAPYIEGGLSVDIGDAYSDEQHRIVIHELGHAFGLQDYYDTGRDVEQIDCLGGFDMQDRDMGDWNPMSRFCCGWIDPIVITEDVESVTLRLGCSSVTGDAVLIPTSRGWNGTAFDEYLMVDVLAPGGNYGNDWYYMTWGDDYLRGAEGGVRILHVDNRMLLCESVGGMGVPYALDTEEAFWDAVALAKTDGYSFWTRYTNSDEAETHLEGDDPLSHQIEIVPRDGSDRFRRHGGTGDTDFGDLMCTDLYGPGDVFSMERCAKAFPHAPYMNNGGTMDYTVTVELYDPETMEAVITIRRAG